MTKTEKIIEFLKKKGCTEVQSKSRKYRKFTKPGTEEFYWVGKAGALRVGRTSTDSFSIAHILKRD